MEPKISIIIANHNSSDYTINCITSIIDKHDMSDKEIIIIDDGSNGEEKGKIRKLWNENNNYKNMKFTMLKENKGLGNAINEGHERVRAKFIIKLDSDTIIIHKNFFDRLAKFLDEDSELGLITCKTDNIGQPLQRMRIPCVFETDAEIEYFVDSLCKPKLTYHSDKQSAYSGMMFMYRREDIEKFDIKYCTKTKFLVEDNIFYLDVLRKMKKKCAIAERLFIKHITNASKGKLFDSTETMRNRELAQEIWEKEEL